MSHFISIIADKTLYTLRASLLLPSTNDASVDIVGDEGSIKYITRFVYVTVSSKLLKGYESFKNI